MTIERGTTQEIRITIKGWDLTGSDIYVTFKQGARILTKNIMDSVTFDNGVTTIILTLTQQETLSFDNNRTGQIQARWIDSNGKVNKTNAATFHVDVCLWNAVLRVSNEQAE